VRSRGYVAFVAAWMLAAVLGLTTALADPNREVRGDREALPLLSPERRTAASLETEDTLPSALGGVVVEPVQGAWRGPGGRAFDVAVRSRRGGAYRHRQIGREVFYLALRLDEPEGPQDPCASCHGGQGIVDGRGEADAARVHHNIRPLHPEETGAQCLTCHAGEDVGRLRLGRGGTASLDHAYRLCAQCHFSQVDSWAKGAHGKRLAGWRGRRVVMGCADCHDPHRPATEPRMPMSGLSLPGALRAPEEVGSHD